MIQVKNISVIFDDKKVLDDLSFDIAKGEIIGLVAPNGTGKSTLLNVLMNYLVPNKGEVLFEELTYQTKKQEQQIHEQITLMPDQSDLYNYLTGREHLAIYRKMWSKTAIDVDSAIKMLQMESYVDKKVGNYSLGMRQRLCFAMQIVSNTTFLLMDEVMNGLDPTNVALLSNILIQKRAEGKTIIIASHLLENLSQYADRVFFLKDGKIMKEIRATDEKEKIIKFKTPKKQVTRIGKYSVVSLPNNTSYIKLEDNLDLKTDMLATLQDFGIEEFSLTHLNLDDWYAYYFGN